MRLIDADAYWKPFEDEKEELEKMAIKTSSDLTALKIIDVIKKRLDAQPTIAQPERKKRRWNTYYHGGTDFSYSCAWCGYSAPFDMKGGKVFQKEWNFCPNCGADMRGKSDE